MPISLPPLPTTRIPLGHMGDVLVTQALDVDKYEYPALRPKFRPGEIWQTYAGRYVILQGSPTTGGHKQGVAREILRVHSEDGTVELGPKMYFDEVGLFTKGLYRPVHTQPGDFINPAQTFLSRLEIDPYDETIF